MVLDRCLPPPDLDDRTLPVHLIDAGDVLYRCHRASLGPLYFSTGHPANRFDDPARTFGVCNRSRGVARTHAATTIT